MTTNSPEAQSKSVAKRLAAQKAAAQPRSLEWIAHELTQAIHHSDTGRTRELLLEFAEEIKRQAIEP